ncbi:ribonuclease P protein component [Candidatus Poribacteria bacterium]|nr:MAG: ribonuclease P protein component [Candidatus Poribacteria bacterium]
MPYQPHPERLKKSWEFQRAYKKGRKNWSPHFVIYVYRTGFSQSRLGITVSKKVGNSVTRNRVRRLIREAFRMLKPGLLPHYDIVVVGRKDAVDLSGQEAEDSLRQVFYRAFIMVPGKVGYRRTWQREPFQKF